MYCSRHRRACEKRRARWNALPEEEKRIRNMQYLKVRADIERRKKEADEQKPWWCFF